MISIALARNLHIKPETNLLPIGGDRYCLHPRFYAYPRICSDCG